MKEETMRSGGSIFLRGDSAVNDLLQELAAHEHAGLARRLKQKIDALNKAETASVTRIDDICSEGFADKAAHGDCLLSDHLLDTLYSFLSDRELTPEWSPRGEGKAFHLAQSPVEQLGIRLTTPAHEFCMILSQIGHGKDELERHAHEMTKLEKELGRLGCENVRDVMRLPVGKFTLMDITPRTRKILLNTVGALNRQFAEKDIYGEAHRRVR